MSTMKPVRIQWYQFVYRVWQVWRPGHSCN